MKCRQSYAEQLRDPRWQRKRLSVLNRDKWACVKCGNTKMELHVDHKAYRGRLRAWEYRMDELQTLCRDCHSEKHDSRKQQKHNPLPPEEAAKKFEEILRKLREL